MLLQSFMFPLGEESSPRSTSVIARTNATYPVLANNIDFLDGTTITWDIPELNDCIFSRYAVSLSGVDRDEYRAAGGTCNSVSSCGDECVPKSVIANEKFLVRIELYCDIPMVGLLEETGTSLSRRLTQDHEFKVEVVSDNSFQAPPRPPGAPRVFAHQESFPEGEQAIIIQVEGGEAYDCEHRNFEVFGSTLTGNEWFPIGCEVTRENSRCELFGGLECNVLYRFKAKETCMDWSESDDSFPSDVVQLELSRRCFARTKAPSRLHVTDPEYFSMVLGWDLVEIEGTFEEYQVQFRDSNGTQDTQVPTGCTELKQVLAGSCRPSELSSGIAYSFRVKVICEEEELSSPWSTDQIIKLFLTNFVM